MMQYALGAEDKQARRDAILTAARELFLKNSESLPSVARIAQTANLAKGTVYIYFRTKEEIFAALLIEDWSALLDEVSAAFLLRLGTAKQQVAAFLHRYILYLDLHPELLRLDALGYSVLEKNLGLDQLRNFKLAFIERLTTTGFVVDEALSLPAGRGVKLLMRTYALTRGLWQSLDYPTSLVELMSDPAVAIIHPDFRGELVEALQEYWKGVLVVE